MKILAIGAHPDDIVLGCLGTLLKFKDRGDDIVCVTCTTGQTREGERRKEEGEAWKRHGLAHYWLDYEDGKMRSGLGLVKSFDLIFRQENPDVVFTHMMDDHHQDHRAVGLATRSANRTGKASVYSYLVNATYSGGVNIYSDITDYFEEKLDTLDIYKSQSDRWYFNRDFLVAYHTNLPHMQYSEKFKLEIGTI